MAPPVLTLAQRLEGAIGRFLGHLPPAVQRPLAGGAGTLRARHHAPPAADAPAPPLDGPPTDGPPIVRERHA